MVLSDKIFKASGVVPKSNARDLLTTDGTKESIKEFVDWVEENCLNEADILIGDKAREIFGEKLT